MKHILIEILSELTPLTAEERLDIEESIPIKVFEKGTYLLREGQVASNSYFVVEGCVRVYELIDGEEKTIAFYTENQSVANFSSLATGTPSKQYFVCNEKATLAILNGEKEEALYQKYPRFGTLCRIGMEKILGEKQSQLAELIALKPEQRYLKLQEERPDLINRVPQFQIASYLGIKPETLSRIRKRLSKSESKM